jgi:hypothetical protein
LIVRRGLTTIYGGLLKQPDKQKSTTPRQDGLQSTLTLRQLPKRLMREEIGVSIWESHITVGNCTYAGALEESGATDPSRIQ